MSSFYYTLINHMKVADKVYISCHTSMGSGSEGWSFISEIETRYDEKTGEPFEILKVEDDWYDERDGSCHSNKKSMYYISGAE